MYRLFLFFKLEDAVTSRCGVMQINSVSDTGVDNTTDYFFRLWGLIKKETEYWCSTVMMVAVDVLFMNYYFPLFIDGVIFDSNAIEVKR